MGRRPGLIFCLRSFLKHTFQLNKNGLILPKASRCATAPRGFFVCPRLRASSRATQQKSRPDYRLVGFVTRIGFFSNQMHEDLKNLFFLKILISKH